ncbi:hypothetical protein MNBD_CHLOROFLEXI01-808 [hydrothermal vent metagenome]|uniref:Uncharacterized protein n=1 Tax=hydrothermal vent metagenome TaxID=652676 RepID=A0A3B0UUZ4_9ZZZZ
MPKKKSTFLLLLLLLFLIIISTISALFLLQDEEIIRADIVPIQDVVVHDSFSEQVHLMYPSWIKVRGYAVGFVWPEYRNTPPDERPQTEEVSLSSGEPFAPYLIVQMAEEMAATTAFVSILLDFQQVEFELDGQKGLLHEITLEPGVQIEVPIKVDIVEPGIHDLAAVIFADPYNSSLDPMYRMSGVSRKTGSRRVIVVVDDKLEHISQLMPQTIQGAAVPKDVQLGFHAAFATSPADAGIHPSERQLYVAEEKAGEIFNYQLWASNFMGDIGSKYALVVFQDYHQVPVAGNYVTIAHLDPGEEIILDASVRLPQTTGVSQMQIIYLFDPYKSILRDEVRAPFVFSSFRIGIHVTDDE